MNALVEGTPISLIGNAEVKWEVNYDIVPIHVDHAMQIAKLISEDEYFDGVDVSMVCHSNEVTNITLKANSIWIDLADFSVVGEHLVNKIVDTYLDTQGGFHAIKSQRLLIDQNNTSTT